MGSTSSYQTFYALKSALFLKYGSPNEKKEPYKSSGGTTGIESYRWNGRKTNISIWYSHKTFDEKIEEIKEGLKGIFFGDYDMKLTFESAEHVRLIKEAREYNDMKNANDVSKDLP
ncbi:MAG: hypothetical protein HY809_09415 [Nitrospirae bacterium]|nr:hypothetical protein [Nitrospirota bacterium]